MSVLKKNMKHRVYNKRLDGRSYTLWATATTRKEADSIAEDERKKGNLVRIFKYKGAYEVYVSWQKRMIK